MLALNSVGPALAGPDEAGADAFSRGDYANAIQLLRPVADAGDPEAQVMLADIYYEGRGVPKDYAQAVDWFRKAADQGAPLGQFYLGLAYINGQGVPKDRVQAHVWFTLAIPRFNDANDVNATLRNWGLKLTKALAQRMTPTEIAEAQRQEQSWVPTMGNAVLAQVPATNTPAAPPPEQHQQAGSAVAPTGAWQVRDKVSALDGSPDFQANLESDETVTDLLDQPKKAALGLVCDHNGFHFVVVWPDFIDKDINQSTVVLTWKIDDGTVQRTDWPATTQGLVQAGTTGLDWAREWSAGKTLIVRVPDKHGGQEATFQLTGLDQVVARVSQMNCG